MTASDREARAGLSRAFEPGSDRVGEVVGSLGAVEVYERLLAGAPVPGLSERLLAGARGRVASRAARTDLDRAASLGARFVVPDDDEWPGHRLHWLRPVGHDGGPPGNGSDGRPGAGEGPGAGPDDDGRPRLREDEAPPLGLWLRGPVELAAAVERSVAVVGARAATPYGEAVASDLAFGLADRDWGVVSGMAYGVDGAAHRGALAAGRAPTVAVLACGVDVPYPSGHARLLEQVAGSGLVVSEVPPGAMASRVRFLVRNRLIAALSTGTVVVEAAHRSGSLSTARLAGALSRHVMAVPGPVTSGASAGCHALLQRPWPQLVTDVADVLALVGAVGEHPAPRRAGRTDPRDALSATVRRVLDAVPRRRAAGVGSIAATAGVSPLEVQQVLPPLVVAGLVERHPDGFRLTPLGASGTAR